MDVLQVTRDEAALPSPARAPRGERAPTAMRAAVTADAVEGTAELVAGFVRRYPTVQLDSRTSEEPARVVGR